MHGIICALWIPCHSLIERWRVALPEASSWTLLGCDDHRWLVVHDHGWRAAHDQGAGMDGMGVMMRRTLVLVRHGKSSWDEGDLPDRARPLAERGRRDAPMMGGRLAREGVTPDLILSSPACRAQETARLLADGLQYRGEIALDERMYEGDVRTLLTLIGGLADDKKCVMLVGHDPEFTALAHHFSRGITRMPTCALARFDFEGRAWSAIPHLIPTRVWFDYPKKR